MKEELKKVMARASECLDDAKYLFEGERYEACVNRAYYSLFTAIQGLLLDKDVFVKTHSGLKSKFHELYIKPGILPNELGKIFENASSMRQEADYDFEIAIAKADAFQIMEDASMFLKALFDYLENK